MPFDRILKWTYILSLSSFSHVLTNVDHILKLQAIHSYYASSQVWRWTEVKMRNETRSDSRVRLRCRLRIFAVRRRRWHTVDLLACQGWKPVVGMQQVIYARIRPEIGFTARRRSLVGLCKDALRIGRIGPSSVRIAGQQRSACGKRFERIR